MNLSISAGATSPQSPIQSAASQEVRLSSPQRWLSLAELIVGGAIVVGHNVYHVIPNEVPILFVIGLISFRVRDGGWSVLGFRWPASWRRTILIALGVAALRILLGGLVIEPLTAHFWPPAVGPAGMDAIKGNLLVAFKWLLLVWTFAAVGEEVGYRGYLTTRGADVDNRSKPAYWVAVLVTSVLFGIGHYYKGPSGMIDSGMAGLLLGSAYLLTGRNLWVCVLAHGFIDTFGVVCGYFGWLS